MQNQNQDQIIVSESDFIKISTLISQIDSEVSDQLDEELGRARIVAPEELPTDVVAMNSNVQYQDLESGKESAVTLVYPQDANIEENKVSVFAPIGAALIGLKEGQIISWPLPNGKEKQIKVLKVTGG